MVRPEYAITSKILRNISSGEYAKAVVETTTILPNWQRQLQKEARIKTLYNNLLLCKTPVQLDQVKRFVDGIDKSPVSELKNLNVALETADEIADAREFDEESLKSLYVLLSGSQTVTYRSRNIPSKVPPLEILAEIVQMIG